MGVVVGGVSFYQCGSLHRVANGSSSATEMLTLKEQGVCRSRFNQDRGVQAESPAHVSSPSLIPRAALQSLLTDYNTHTHTHSTFHTFCAHSTRTDHMLILPQTEPPATGASQTLGLALD